MDPLGRDDEREPLSDIRPIHRFDDALGALELNSPTWKFTYPHLTSNGKPICTVECQQAAPAGPVVLIWQTYIPLRLRARPGHG